MVCFARSCGRLQKNKRAVTVVPIRILPQNNKYSALYIDTTATANFKSATDIHGASWKFTIAKAEQSAPAASLFTTVAPTATTTTDGKITGITAQMEYRKVGDSAWTSGTGSDVTGLSSGRYQIRFKETDNYNAGEVVEVQVPESGVSSLLRLRALRLSADIFTFVRPTESICSEPQVNSKRCRKHPTKNSLSQCVFRKRYGGRQDGYGQKPKRTHLV